MRCLCEFLMWELLAHTYGTTRQVFHKHQYYKRSILEFFNWILPWTICSSKQRENFRSALFSLSLSSPSFYLLLTLEKKKLWKYNEPSCNETVAMVFKGSDWNTHCGCQSPPIPANIRLSTSLSQCFASVCSSQASHCPEHLFSEFPVSHSS